MAKALLAEGFRGFGQDLPTHVFYCTVQLAKDAGRYRCLFNIYLALQPIKGDRWQDWLALRVAESLKQTLEQRRDLDFLIRCKSEREYPWCLAHNALDLFWLMECGAYYRFYLRKLEALNLVREEGEATRLQ